MINVAILAATLAGGCGRPETQAPAATKRVADFVTDTLNLELKGVRWGELMGTSSTDDYYNRFAWPPDVEPGWDILFVSNSFAILSITPVSSRSLEEYKGGDVQRTLVPGFEVQVRFDDVFKFGVDSFQEARPTTQPFFVFERDGVLLFGDRLHPPRFDVSSALRLLAEERFKASSLNPLREQLRAQVGP